MRWGGLALGFLVMGCLVWAAGQPNPLVPYPRDFRQNLVQYAIVDRPDGRSRDLYISRPGLEALRRNQPLPVGTVVAIETFSVTGEQDSRGRMVRQKAENQVHVMTKVQPGEGLRAWGFGAYTLDAVPEPGTSELPSFCLACHQIAMVKSEPIISLDMLKQFAATAEVQYFRCNRPEREVCP